MVVVAVADGVGMSVWAAARAGRAQLAVIAQAAAVVNTAPVQGAGHFHLYVDGVKIDRCYMRAYHLNTALKPGKHTVTVNLNANDHSPWSRQGQEVQASRTITVPAT